MTGGAIALGVATVVVPASAALPSPSEAAAATITILVLSWIGVLVHQLGHAGAGHFTGMQPRLIGAGPVMIDLAGDRPVLRLSSLRRLTSGFVLCTPGKVEPDRYLRVKLWMVLAGPAAQSAYGLVALACWRVLPGPSWLVWSFFLVAILNLLMAGLNLAPFTIGPVRSDERHLLTLLRGGIAAEAVATESRWLDFLLSPETPGSWPEEIIQEQEQALFFPGEREAAVPVLPITAGYLLYLHYADRHEWIEANHVIARAVDLPRPPKAPAGGSHFDRVDTVYAVHLALRGGNAYGARSAIERIAPRSPMRRSTLFNGAMGAVAMVEGDRELAISRGKKARKLLAPTLAYIGADRLEDSWWQELLERASAMTAPDPIVFVNREAAPIAEAWLERSVREDRFMWDPGCVPELRAIWLWRVTIGPTN